MDRRRTRRRERILPAAFSHARGAIWAVSTSPKKHLPLSRRARPAPAAHRQNSKMQRRHHDRFGKIVDSENGRTLVNLLLSSMIEPFLRVGTDRFDASR